MGDWGGIIAPRCYYPVFLCKDWSPRAGLLDEASQGAPRACVVPHFTLTQNLCSPRPCCSTFVSRAFDVVGHGGLVGMRS